MLYNEENIMLKHIIKILAAFVVIVILYMIGCSDTYFGSLKTVSCSDFVGVLGKSSADCGRIPVENPQTPSDEIDRRFLEFKYRIPLGKIDILFVVDNSSSMHEEHTNLAKQFKYFLDDIKYLDYRIAIITTDISSSPNNPVSGAAYQDGKFIPIGGRPFLRNSRIGSYASDRDIQSFTDVLVRPETIACDSSSGDHSASDEYYFQYGVDKPKIHSPNSPCPSHDERGIFALNLALENPNHSSFFRTGESHLMMVIISDEDERSSSRYIANKFEEGDNSYQFEDNDYPEVLVDNVYRKFGDLKSFSFHSIIIPPGDHSCYNRQVKNSGAGSGSGRGYYGEEYARLSKARDKSLLRYGNLLRGNVISICNRKYGSQLGKIALYADTTRAFLPCSNPEQIQFKVNGHNRRLSYEIEGRTLILTAGQVSLTSDLELNVICEE